jgi:hypothetical protein
VADEAAVLLELVVAGKGEGSHITVEDIGCVAAQAQPSHRTDRRTALLFDTRRGLRAGGPSREAFDVTGPF